MDTKAKTPMFRVKRNFIRMVRTNLQMASLLVNVENVKKKAWDDIREAVRASLKDMDALDSDTRTHSHDCAHLTGVPAFFCSNFGMEDYIDVVTVAILQSVRMGELHLELKYRWSTTNYLISTVLDINIPPYYPTREQRGIQRVTRVFYEKYCSDGLVSGIRIIDLFNEEEKLRPIKSHMFGEFEDYTVSVIKAG